MSKKSFIDSLNVKTPCTESWDEMTGNDRVRFCSHCAKKVNNLSEMTRDEAIRLVRRLGGRLCIRYIKDPRTNAPVFSDRVYNVSQRAPVVAAGVMTASLALSTAAYGQGDATVPNIEQTIVRSNESISNSNKSEADAKQDGGFGSVVGTVVDPMGAVVPGAELKLVNEKTAEELGSTSNDEGAFRFENLPAGTYRLKFEGRSGFASSEIDGIETRPGSETVQPVTLQLAVEAVTMGVMVAAVEYKNALSLAVQNGDLAVIRDLIARGEKVNGKDQGGITPLFIAIEAGSVDAARILLEFGAKVNARNDAKETPLMRLGGEASRELVELLLDYGAKVNHASQVGNTTLITAASYAKAEVLQTLIDAGADVNARNKDGQTALMSAVYGENLENVRILLEAGAKVDVKNNDDESALDLTENEEIRILLISFGATPTEP